MFALYGFHSGNDFGNKYILKINCNFKPFCFLISWEENTCKKNEIICLSFCFQYPLTNYLDLHAFLNKIKHQKPTVHRVATASTGHPKKGWSQSEKSLRLTHYICSNQSWITKHFGSFWLFLSKNIKLRFSSLFRLPFWTNSNIQAHCAPRRNSTKWSPEGRCACEKTTIHIGINLMQGYSLLSYLMYGYITSIL